MLIIDSRHCLFDGGKCANCDRKMSNARQLFMCPKGTKDEKPRATKHRPRTAEEYVTITAICQACEHFTGELCELKKAGCRACQSAAKFAQWKMSGAPCPDKPPRFDGTPLVE